MTTVIKNNRQRALKISFAEQRSDANWAPVINRRRDALPALDVLKRRLLKMHLERVDQSLHPWVRRAADDAVSLAWTLPFPELFLPNLLAEKAEQATRRAKFQRSVLERGPSWTSLTA
ncbi:MAG: hypothetical protein H7X97_01785 [Opitutaceae bacterium]|nr:hypothetical protein [Verrucomicrobiales bacterium]